MSWQQASLNSPEKARENSLKNGWWGVDASGIRLMKTSVSTVPAKYADSCRYFESLNALPTSHYSPTTTAGFPKGSKVIPRWQNPQENAVAPSKAKNAI
jgi:hypothetical protein